MPKGVEVRGGKIRIWFAWNGTRCREVLHVSNSPVNLRYAERLRSEIVAKIRLGAFKYGEYFPDSPRAGVKSGGPPRFRDYALRYISLRPDLAKSTLKSYRAALNGFWIPAIGNKTLTEIIYTDILEALSGKKWKSNKTRNNYLIVARTVFDSACRDRIVDITH